MTPYPKARLCSVNLTARSILPFSLAFSMKSDATQSNITVPTKANISGRSSYFRKFSEANTQVNVLSESENKVISEQS